MKKIFQTYDQLISFLQTQKDLIINDKNYAKQILAKTSYFSLISGYKNFFKYPTTGKYKKGTTFEDIYALYVFDRNLRSIFLKYILIAEQSVKTSLAHHFTESYGEGQTEYLSTSHYMVTNANQSKIQQLINILSYNITHKSNYAYITHYKKNYQNVPLWIMIQILTLGQISHMYDFLKASVSIKICQDHHNIKIKDMHSFLSIMTKHRNVCAHGDRLFNYVTKDCITDTAIHKKLRISTQSNRYQNGKNDLFSEVIILKYLLDSEDFRNFYYDLKQCIYKYCPHTDIITIMGFPKNWTKILRLKP